MFGFRSKQNHRIRLHISLYTVPVNQSISCAFKFHIVPTTATAIARPLSASKKNGNGSASDVILPKKKPGESPPQPPLDIVQQKQSQSPCMCKSNVTKECVCVCYKDI